MAAPRSSSLFALAALIAVVSCTSGGGSPDTSTSGTAVVTAPSSTTTAAATGGTTTETAETTDGSTISFRSSGVERDGWSWLEQPDAVARWDLGSPPAGDGALALDLRAAIAADLLVDGSAMVPVRWGQGDTLLGEQRVTVVATPSAHQADFALVDGTVVAAGVDRADTASVWMEVAAPDGGTIAVRAESVGATDLDVTGQTVDVQPAAAPVRERLDGEFTTNGDLISGWYWVRDAAYAQYARWRFPEVPDLAGGVTLQFHVLATDGPDGGPGVDARFYLTYGWVTTFEDTGVTPADSWGETILVTVANVSPPSDPVGYTAQGTVDLALIEVPADAVGLWLEARRDDPSGAGAPTTEHVAFAAASVGLLAAPAGGDTDGTGDNGTAGGEDEGTGGTVTDGLLVDPDGMADADTMADADVVGDLPSGTYEGTMGADDTEDWFAIRLGATQIVDVSVIPHDGLDVTSELWDPLHQVRAPSDLEADAPSYSFAADRGNGGRWYLHVVRLAGAGGYMLSVQVRDPNDGLQGVDAGDDRTTALAVGAGDLLGEVDRADSGDHYAIQLATGQSLTIELQSLNTQDYALDVFGPTGARIDDDIAYPDEPAVLFVPAGAARQIDMAVSRSGGFGGRYVLRLEPSGVGECTGDLGSAASYRTFGDGGTALTGTTPEWRWLAADAAAARTQFATWSFDVLPDESTVRVMLDLPVVPTSGTTPVAASAYATWGVTPGGTTSPAAQLVTLQVQSRPGSVTGFGAVGEIDIPHGQVLADGVWWVRLSLAAPGQAGIGTVAPLGVGTAATSVQVCAEGTVELLDGEVDPIEPPAVVVTYDGATRTLVSDEPIFVDPTTDVDGDGLNQYWEDQAMVLADPVVEVDEEELWLHSVDDVATVNLVQATLFPSAADPQYVVLGYLSTWGYDPGGGIEYFQVQLSEQHRGDSERIWTAWRILDERHVRLEWVNTSAHMSMTDHSAVWHATDRTCNVGNVASVDLPSTEPDWGFQQVLCGNLEFDAEGRLVVYTSENKHAMYPTSWVCDHVALAADATAGGSVWGEDCGWDTVDDPFGIWWDDDDFDGDDRYVGAGRWRFHTFNVGEPGFPLIDALDATAGLPFEYPTEAVWSGHAGTGSNFCGGLEQGDVIEMPWYRADLVMPERCSTLLGGKFAGWQQPFLDALAARYRVELVTGTDAGAGTDEAVFLELVGSDGSLLAATGVRGYWGDLEAGATDVVRLVPATAAGTDVTSVHVHRSAAGVGSGPDWQLGAIEVTDLVTGRVTTFQVDQWVLAGPGITIS